MRLARKTLGDQVWAVRAAQVYLARDGRPTDRTYWLIVARHVATGEVKYFVSNAPPRTALLTLMRVAFTRWGIEHVFRLAKTEVGLGHFEGRSYKGLMRHMALCQRVLLFATRLSSPKSAEQTDRLRGETSGGDGRADGPGAQRAVPDLARAPVGPIANRERRRRHPAPPGPESSRPVIPTARFAQTGVAP